ncbi:DUF350 domain-containing protein [Micromonospora sp. WMMD1102]|uniref:DUF350 domain-containing protein n=1 Tax=Micromonospora sp. WMMD1102 TaxID=3016105 RepID=UPI00241552C1|nr:DUF350 domain-containing protein [Micromonospora sp. WMMD1102]MDG4788953.1 DUF350 domain-containing protein [Micromonospora sp. WMMD1102]
MVEDLLVGAWQSIVFGAVGIALMAAGFGLIDLLTPGRLRELIWVRRNGNAALLLLANQLGIAAIVFTAILTSYTDFAKGLASTVVFGVVGLGVMALGFLVLDWLTPGRLGEVICTDEPHPAARVSAATHFGAALIVCACIA